MGHAPRKVVAALYAKPPWIPVEVKIGQKWKRANVLRQADRGGLCLVSVRDAPDSEPIMVPLSTIRIPSNPRVAKRRKETRPEIQVKKPRFARSSDAEGDDEMSSLPNAHSLG